MSHLIAQNLAPIMFAALVIFLLLGYPVAFALAANGLLFFVIAVELAPFAPDVIRLDWPLLQALPERIYQTMGNEVLLAVPFFTFMGLILERSGMAEDLLDTIGQLFGTVRGGLAYAVIFVGALLAATTGVVAASVISMGLISLPIMLRYGYDRRLASGVIAASGTLAQIIPPSLVLIVMADQLGRSVGDMYEGAFVPGLVLSALYAGYVLLVTLIFPKAGPGLPPDAIGYREPNGARGVWQLGVLVLFSGLVGYYVLSQTATRAGADFVILTICVGTVVALICALMNRVFGAQRVILSLVVTAALIALYVILLRAGYTTLGLIMEMVAAGALYASVVGVLERFTGFRLMSRMAEQVTFVMVPPLLLIFLVLGTIFIGLATPTEGGAMGALGSLILAADQAPSRQQPGPLQFRDHSPSHRGDCEALGLRALHPARRARVLAHLLRRERPCLGRASADVAARRPGRLPDLRQHLRVPARLLPRLLRARLHRHPAARARRGKARDRPHLVRRDARREHADVVHAPALRLRALLPALGRRERALYRPRHRQAHGARDDRPDLLGRGAVRGHPVHHGGPRHPVPADGDALQELRNDRSTRPPCSRSSTTSSRASTRPAAEDSRAFPRSTSASRRRSSRPPAPTALRLPWTGKRMAPERPGPLWSSSEIDYPRARARIMKLSKVYSATWNQRYSSFRKFV